MRSRAARAVAMRRRAPRRARRKGLLARLALMLGALGLAAWVLTSERFLVREVTVEGAALSDTATVREAAQDALRGCNLLLVSAEGVGQAMRSLPTVADVSIKRRWPDRLLIRIRERQPVAVMAAGDQRWLVDSEGVVVGPASDEADLPVVPASVTRDISPGDALKDESVVRAVGVASLARRLEVWPLKRIESDKYGGITCVSSEGVRIRCGPPTRLETKLRLAAAVLDARKGEPLVVVDVADPSSPFLRKEVGKP